MVNPTAEYIAGLAVGTSLLIASGGIACRPSLWWIGIASLLLTVIAENLASYNTAKSQEDANAE